jgi:hypothetical protein
VSQDRNDAPLPRLCAHQVPLGKCTICPQEEPTELLEQVDKFIQALLSRARHPIDWVARLLEEQQEPDTPGSHTDEPES